MARQINSAGLELIKQFEGLKDGDKDKPGYQPYIAPEGQPTTGWGHVLVKGDEWMKDGITIDQATEILKKDLERFCAAVERLVKVPINDNEFAALVAFAFNVGEAALAKSSLLKILNARKDGNDIDCERKVAAEFLKWNKTTDPKTGKKVVLAGLTRRRQAEATLYMTDPPKPPQVQPAVIGGGLVAGVGSIDLIVAQAPSVLEGTKAVVQPVQKELKDNGIELPAITTMLTVIIVLIGLAIAAQRVMKYIKDKKNRGVNG